MWFLSKTRSAGQWLSAVCFLAGSLSAALADYPIVYPSATTNSLPAAVTSTNGHNYGPATPETGRLSPWLVEFGKLAQAGLEDEVLLSFISNTEGTFNLTADQIVWLRDLGVSGGVINAMIEHDRELMLGLRELTGASVPGQSLLPVLARNMSAEPAHLLQPSSAASSSIIVRDEPKGWRSIVQAVNEEPEMPSHGVGGLDCPEKPWRVRKPHPVRLTDPILLFRCSPRIPNVLIIQPLR